jgi:alkanesulfonate monooxygenase SsuD/methylene tetrahydromethanopterin reductase-like flavin-dependent oxidoreductase (luciferase family)
MEAEAAGWDGAFTWDGINVGPSIPVSDPWATLAAMAVRTERLTIGAVVTPVARRRPWKLARETVTVDRLSGGRLVIPVALGATDDGGFDKVGEPTDRRTRAELLDEGLEILTGLWSGEPFRYAGRHHRLDEMTFIPRPVQRPRIPIWVVGAWPRERSMARAARYDGVMPSKQATDGSFGQPLTPDDIRELRAWLTARRPDGAPFDIVLEGETPGDDPTAAAAQVRSLAEAGATWWLEGLWDAMQDPDRVRRRIVAGPPPSAA